jgi:hypothetical protein
MIDGLPSRPTVSTVLADGRPVPALHLGVRFAGSGVARTRPAGTDRAGGWTSGRLHGLLQKLWRAAPRAAAHLHSMQEQDRVGWTWTGTPNTYGHEGRGGETCRPCRGNPTPDLRVSA